MTSLPADDAFPRIDTPRLRLRRLLHEDAPALLAIHSDPEVMRHYGSDPLPDLAAAVKMVDNFDSWRRQPNPGVRWGIEQRGSGALIGTCGLFRWNRHWRSCVIGYELAREAWGQGFMLEALGAALAWAFEAMQIERVEAQIHPENEASKALLRKLGFQPEGLAREAGFWGGRRQDLAHFGLLRREARLPHDTITA